LVLILLGLGLWVFKKRRAGDTPEKEVSLAQDASVRLLWLGLVAASVYLVFDTVLVPLNLRAAERKWAEIGRPMAEFEREHLGQVEENQSLRDLAKDLEPFQAGSLYKPAEGDSELRSLPIPPGITPLLERDGNPEDAMPPFPSLALAAALSGTERQIAEAVQFLDEHAQDLDRLYRGILGRTTPVWAIDPKEVPRGRVPNYLSLRNLNRLIFADSLLKTQRGDLPGAQRAVAAASRAFEGLDRQLTTVSFMIYPLERSTSGDGSPAVIVSSIIALNQAKTDSDIYGGFNGGHDLIQHLSAGMTVLNEDGTNLEGVANPMLGSLGMHGGRPRRFSPW
jgi:hypothetical protein